MIWATTLLQHSYEEQLSHINRTATFREASSILWGGSKRSSTEVVRTISANPQCIHTITVQWEKVNKSLTLTSMCLSRVSCSSSWRIRAALATWYATNVHLRGSVAASLHRFYTNSSCYLQNCRHLIIWSWCLYALGSVASHRPPLRPACSPRIAPFLPCNSCR